MFEFLFENRVKKIVEKVSVGVLTGIGDLTLPDRFGVFTLAHAMMVVGSESWSKEVESSPSNLNSNISIQIVMYLSERHGKILNEILVPIQDRGMNDITYSQAVRELRAIECVIVTVGARWVPRKYGKLYLKVWKMLWNAKSSREETFKILVRYMNVSKVVPVPLKKGVKKSNMRDYMASLMMTVPEFLKKRSGASKKKVNGKGVGKS